MRIRQVRREFWTDRRISLLPKSTRLFYIGLWCVADDDGYLRWDLPQIAGELFSFESVKRRETDIEHDAERLIEAGRIVVLDCGRHAAIPTLPEHQRLGGNLVVTYRKEHEREGSVLAAVGVQTSPAQSDRNGKVSNGMGMVGGGTGGDGRRLPPYDEMVKGRTT